MNTYLENLPTDELRRLAYLAEQWVEDFYYTDEMNYSRRDDCITIMCIAERELGVEFRIEGYTMTDRFEWLRTAGRRSHRMPDTVAYLKTTDHIDIF